MKINFLKGLQNGKRNINELIPDTYKIVLDCDDAPGSVYDVVTGKVYSADHVSRWRQKSTEGSQIFIEL